MHHTYKADLTPANERVAPMPCAYPDCPRAGIVWRGEYLYCTTCDRRRCARCNAPAIAADDTGVLHCPRCWQEAHDA